jgi:hypothetical protein
MPAHCNADFYLGTSVTPLARRIDPVIILHAWSAENRHGRSWDKLIRLIDGIKSTATSIAEWNGRRASIFTCR